MLKPSDNACDATILPPAMQAALAREFPARTNKNGGPRISPTAELLARQEWQQVVEWDLPFESMERMTDFVLQAVRARMKRLMEGEAG